VIARLVTISALLLGIALLLLGNGLLTTLLTLRGSADGLGDGALGLITSSYFAGFLLGIYLAPRLVRRIGHIRAFAFCAGMLAACSLSYGLWIAPAAWLGLRVLTGVGLATLYAVVESWLNYQTPEPERGRVFSIYMVINLGALAAAQQLLRLASPLDYTLFAIAAILASLALMPVTWTRLPQPQIVTTELMPLRAAWRAAPLAVAGILAAGLAMGAFWGLAPLYARNLGFERDAVATYMSLSILGGALLQWPLGHLSDRNDRRQMLLAVAAGAAGGAALLGLVPQLLPGNRAALYASAALYAGFAFSLYSIAITHLIDRITHQDLMAGTSTLLLVYGVGATLGPALAGAAMALSGNPALPAFYLAVTAALAVTCWRQLQRRPAQPAVEAPAHFVPMLRTGPAALELHPDTRQAARQGAP
jgi:MFS family permease